MSASARSIDVAEVRRRHPIEDVIVASGVDLHRSGHGFMGCCPFHDDSTASLSVGGKVPDRFHCFGCGASGDVIDYVQRREGLGFRDAVAYLNRTDLVTAVPRPRPASRQHQDPWMLVSVERSHEIHALAWNHLTSKVRHEFAVSYLRHHRNVDVRALESEVGQPVIGHSGRSWSWLTDRLLRDGVSIDELLATDLAHRRRGGYPLDSFHRRLMVPVRSSTGQIAGFIGRKIDDVERGPKYRNPTRTSTFEKSKMLYSPVAAPAGPHSTAVVVEGPLDALAVAAAAASVGRLDDFWACSANGVTVSPVQADQLVEAGAEQTVIALDGDAAGAEGTVRWVDAVCRGLGRAVMVTRLPESQDPADWLAIHGTSGLAAFDPCWQPSGQAVAPGQPGHELVQAIAAHDAADPIRETVDTVVPLSLLSPSPRQALELLTQVESEMRLRGWDPQGTAIPVLRGRAMERERAAGRARPISAHASAGRGVDLL